MDQLARPLLAIFCLLALACVSVAQSNEAKKATTGKSPVTDSKPVKNAEADRARKERLAQVRSLLLSLASDARSFRDQTLRARTLARIADALWDADTERGRELFRKRGKPLKWRIEKA